MNRKQVARLFISALVISFVIVVILIIRASYPDMNRNYAIQASSVAFFDRKTWNDEDANYSEEYLGRSILKLEVIKKYQAEIPHANALYHNMVLENGTFITYSDNGHVLIVKYPIIQINSDNLEKEVTWKCFSIPENYLSGKCRNNKIVPINKSM